MTFCPMGIAAKTTTMRILAYVPIFPDRGNTPMMLGPKINPRKPAMRGAGMSDF